MAYSRGGEKKGGEKSTFFRLPKSPPLSCLTLDEDWGMQLTESDTFPAHIWSLSRAAGLPRSGWSSTYWGGGGDRDRVVEGWKVLLCSQMKLQ